MKTSWLLAIIDAWHGTHITSKALRAHGDVLQLRIFRVHALDE